MNSWTNARGVVAAIACTAMALVACSGTPDSGLPPQGTVTNEFTAQSAMRDAWLDETQWTQLYVMAVAAARPDAQAADARLQSADDAIVAVVAPVFEAAQASSFGQLLHVRSDDMRAVVAAQAKGDATAAAAATAAWLASSDRMASFLGTLGPAWSAPAFQLELRRGVRAMRSAIDASFASDRVGEVTAGARAETHALALGDLFAGGLTAQFPVRFGASGMSAASETFHLELRPLFQEQVFWTRVAIIEHTSDEDARAALARAVVANAEIARVFGTVVPPGTATDVQHALRDQVEDAYAYVLALESGDPTAPSTVQAKWYADGDSLATLLGHTSSSFPYDALQTLLRAHADATIAEINARRAGAWTVDVSAYDAVVTNARTLTEALAAGLGGASVPQPR